MIDPVWWALGGVVVGATIVNVINEILFRRRMRRMKMDPRDVQQPTKYPYPLDHETRRAMVLRHIVVGKLGLDEAKEFLADGTISVNDYREALAESRLVQNPVPMPRPGR